MARTDVMERKNTRTSSRKASGTVVPHTLVTLDLSDDADGGSVKAISALTDRPFGASEAGITTGFEGEIVESGVIPLVCVDSTCAVDVDVYNDITGKVSATQGSGARLVGHTRSRTLNANELVCVKLNIA